MECHEPTPAATSMAAERFGAAIMIFGPVVNAAIARHLADQDGGSASVDWSFPTFRCGVADAPAASSSTRPHVTELSDDDIEDLRATARGKNLLARMTGSGGHTVEYFSEVDQLTKMIKRCKGVAGFNAGIFNAAERIATHAQHGGLALNWFQIGYDQRGVCTQDVF